MAFAWPSFPLPQLSSRIPSVFAGVKDLPFFGGDVNNASPLHPHAKLAANPNGNRRCAIMRRCARRAEHLQTMDAMPAKQSDT
jgi:hypothetical protein